MTSNPNEILREAAAPSAEDDDVVGAEALEPIEDEAPPVAAAAGPETQGERFFWVRLAAILLVAGAVGWLGVQQVGTRSASIRIAYKLARIHEELREQADANRRDAALLTGRMEANALRSEAVGRFGMRVPGAADTVEVKAR
jgi:hypothetical protein